MKFSLIMSTLGRKKEVFDFIDSLKTQDYPSFELIIVDQNADNDILKFIDSSAVSYSLKYLHCPEMRGLSRGRNAGINQADGDILCFPDDDCIYPDDLLQKVFLKIKEENADILCGRAVDKALRSINGRYETVAQAVSRHNVFTTQIEWVTFFKKEVFESGLRYDEAIGIGASTIWQANEGQDIVLRALKNGFTAYYDPNIYAHHEELNIYRPDEKMLQKARGYARGMGYVMGIHNFPIGFAMNYVLRALGGVLIFTMKLNLPRAKYYYHVLMGRIEGYRHGISAVRSGRI
ncbi:glycosyltransferase family 2 protein [Asticcacaulis tiandongensis]|uniref:glycosyltransferase family 2 protein n=1 Tax=Asticcacaulis tiandongensis TaxID=2565365 RepID=UPI00112AE918|nr:glycosyltransferase family 2 protein [Asticcacaulis tiandongensis]